MNQPRALLFLVVLAILALGGYLLFGGGSGTEPLTNPTGIGVTGDPDAAVVDDAKGGDAPAPAVEASGDRTLVRTSPGTSALDPSIVAALSGFRGRTVTPEGKPVPATAVELFRFAPDSVMTAGVSPMLDQLRYEPDVDAGDTTSNGRGEFEITGVWPRGFYLLRAGKGTDTPVLRVVDEIPGPGQIVDLGDVVLAPSGTITGVVVDEDGTPVPDALVRAADIPGQLLAMAPVEQFDPAGGVMIRPGRTDRVLVAECPPWVERRFEQLPIPQAKTDTNGAFRLTGVVPGANLVAVTKRGLLPFVKPRVKVAAGEERDVGEITLREGESLIGRVVDRAGDPVAGAEILAAPVGSIPVYFARFTEPSNENGEFEMTGFPSQEVIVAARETDRDPWVILDPQPITRDVEIVLPSAFGLEVTLTSEAGLPIADPEFQIVPGELGEGAVEMAMWGASQPVDLTTRVSRPDADAPTWKIDDIPAGKFALLTRCDGHAVAATQLDVEGATKVDVTLSANARFDVRVVDAAGAPIRGAKIFVEARGKRPRVPEMPFCTGTTDENGMHVVDDILATEARLTASHPAYGNAHARTSVPPAESIVLRMEEPGVLEGVVTEGGQAPTPGKWTLAIDRDWDANDRGAMPNMPTLTVPDLDGAFRVTGLRPGSYEIRPIDSIRGLTSPGAIMNLMQSARMMSFRDDRSFEIRSGQTTSIRFDTEGDDAVQGPTGQVTGTVLIDGAPAEGLTVTIRANGQRKSADVGENGRFDLGQVKVDKNARLEVFELPDKETLSMRLSEIHSEQILIEENEIIDVSISIQMSGASGFVAAVDGSAAKGVEVRLRGSSKSGGRISLRTASDADGFFEFRRVPEGVYTISARDEIGRTSMPDIEVQAGVARTGLRLSLVRMMRVKGSVNVVPFGERENDWMWLRFMRRKDDGSRGESHWVGCNRDTYEFDTTDLSAGTWEVRIHGPQAPDGQEWHHDGTILIGTTDIEGVVIQPVLRSRDRR